ncbi:MAG TPA: hypothetical protein VD902_02320 [Symbiobacteriaceae bacterium]|nr:hypothetical protein [Symbiobacteriaceae bacterium]
MADHRPLPQEFPRDLALLRLADVAPDLAPGVREAFTAAFERRRDDPRALRGLLLVGAGGLRPLMALMRLVVLRFRDLNFELFEQQGGEGRLLSAYCCGESLPFPLPDRADALFIERGDRVDPKMAPSIAGLIIPVFATWEGPEGGPVWDALVAHCDLIRL